MAKKLRVNYKLIYVLADIILCFTTGVVSFLSFYGFHAFVENIASALIYSAGISLLTVVAFIFAKVYRIITINIGIFESIRIMLATLIVHVIGLIVVSCVPYLPTFSPFVFTWMLATIALIFLHPLLRISVRVFNIAAIITAKENRVRTIVIGAGATGKVVVDESRRNKYNHNKIVAIVDDDPNKIGGLFANFPVKGPISNIATIIDYYKAGEVIIAMSKISQERLREILQLLDSCPVRVRRMPLISEMEGPNDKRIIDVDMEDLLAREPVVLDNSQIDKMLNGKCVLVTGAGGSIGSELTRQIFNTHPATLILFDIYENSTYDIQMELMARIRNENIKDIKLVTLIGSTYNDVRVEQILRDYRPDYIYHAAAYKHVPLMEDSPAEAIRTNVIGTYNVARLADKYGVKKMVLVSTDKAVRPTNVMGATKRFAETIIQYFSEKSKTKYAAVRFGNVLGSNGSVVPLFKKQIEAGGPVTLTHKDIIRYFMTIPEAVGLILQCGLFAEGGEIFILDMGKPVKILSLAERLIRQAGLVPYVDIDIVETGLRPGEKLFEELLLDLDHQEKTENNRIYIENKESVNINVVHDVEEASKAFGVDETPIDVKELLHKLIKTYIEMPKKK
jgi:FlaA1/EpsC-like NDP-sugar epimerase